MSRFVAVHWSTGTYVDVRRARGMRREQVAHCGRHSHYLYTAHSLYLVSCDRCNVIVNRVASSIAAFARAMRTN